jgi:hypothetical protein
MRAGTGGMMLDPNGQLTRLVLERIPQERSADVELLDLSDEAYPPALNLLACAPSQANVQVEALCGIFRRLFARFWGPRQEDIFRSALATLLMSPHAPGEEPTLADVLFLLSEPDRRARYRAGDPIALGQFWRQWEALSEGQRQLALAPLANKLRSLLGNPALRNILCQPGCPDLKQTIAQGGWLLVSLPASLDEDGADLIGSVLIYRAWQAAQQLGPLIADERPPFLCLVDECHRFCKLPQGLASSLAQARGLGLGFVLAHQNLAQLQDHGLAEAVEANCQTKLCFALEPADARRMAAHFEPRLSAYDLQHLGAYRVACRVMHEGRQLPAATAATLPVPTETSGDPAGVIRARAHERSTERTVVEAAILDRYGSIQEPPSGRAAADMTWGDDPNEGGPSGSPSGGPPDGPHPKPGIPRQRGDHAPGKTPTEIKSLSRRQP